MKFMTVACAVTLAVLGSAAAAQNQPKPVSRSDVIKNMDGKFASIDTNHDGSLSVAELTAEQERELQAAKNGVAQQVTAKFKQLDTNKDGSLSLQEFLAISPQVRAQGSAAQLVQQIDTNHDGKVSPEEFRAPQMANFNKADA